MAIDYTQFFNPAAWGSWAPPSSGQGMLGSQIQNSPSAPSPGGLQASPTAPVVPNRAPPIPGVWGRLMASRTVPIGQPSAPVAPVAAAPSAALGATSAMAPLVPSISAALGSGPAQPPTGPASFGDILQKAAILGAQPGQRQPAPAAAPLSGQSRPMLGMPY